MSRYNQVMARKRNAAERRAQLLACEQARADVKQTFPTITPENFEEANAFQENRIAYHYNKNKGLNS